MNTSELRAAAELMGMLLTDPRTLLLLVLLFAGAVWDARTYRIPNLLTMGGSAAALLYSMLVPLPFHNGLLWALAGLAVGLVMMLPLYLLHAMGAGDVKLMAMAGAFLGPDEVVRAVIFVFITGGIAAVSYSLWHRAAASLVRNTLHSVQMLFISASAGIRPDARQHTASIGKLPYGVSIAIGTTAFLVARQFTWI
ncbi:prepilin peptidase [Comamonas humi]